MPAHTSDDAERSSLVLSVIKAFGLLETIAAAPDGLALRDLSRQNDLHPSTSHRLLHTLIEIGYVRQDARTRRYHLGSRAHTLVTATRKQFDLQDMAIPHLRRLAEYVRETVSLYVLDGIEVMRLAQAESPSSAVQTFSQIGAHMPAYCMASGKALLAYIPPQQCEDLLAAMPLEHRTPNTITQIDDLRVELDRVRRRGYAVDDEEHELGVRCIAAVVRDANAQPVAALSISGPSGRVSVHRLADLAQTVQDAAARLSHDLGFQSAASVGG